MPRNRKRKTNIGQHAEEEMRAALHKISEGQKIKTVAKLMNIPYTTLYRYNEKIKKSLNANPIDTNRVTPNYTVRKIFKDLMLLSVGDTQNEPLPSTLTELPRICQLASQAIETTSQTTTTSLIKPIESTPSTSRAEPSKPFTSPFEFRGIPKAGARKHGRAERRKGKSMIATDTPNKTEIEQRTKEKNKGKKRKESAKAAKKKIFESDSEETDTISLYSEEEPTFDEEEDKVIHIDPTKFSPLQTSPKEGNFILVEFKVKEKKFYYIAKVIGNKVGDIEVSFLRKSVKSNNKFHMPNIPDIATITLQDIKMIPPQPGFTGSTKRAQGLYCFDIESTKIDLR